ncbi:hypothetical protein [Cryobacterium aureum]|uniref:hypothetical protein n=1 Tax=Cryobacterium aureum TaxID=995037 RepID=UPI00101ADAC2|nr:hypothetical protein [Cryobacterium aureum]
MAGKSRITYLLVSIVVFLGSGAAQCVPIEGLLEHAGCSMSRVRRLRRLCGSLAVASVPSPAWMLHLGLGVDQGGSGAADPYTQIPIYVWQLLIAGL